MVCRISFPLQCSHLRKYSASGRYDKKSRCSGSIGSVPDPFQRIRRDPKAPHRLPVSDAVSFWPFLRHCWKFGHLWLTGTSWSPPNSSVLPHFSNVKMALPCLKHMLQNYYKHSGFWWRKKRGSSGRYLSAFCDHGKGTWSLGNYHKPGSGRESSLKKLQVFRW